jgi:hypothetical protein
MLGNLPALYNAQWPQGAALDPYLLASMPVIEKPRGFHPKGGEGFRPWNQQNMLFEMQKLAKERAELLARVAVYDAQLGDLQEEVAKLDALHQNAHAVYNQYLNNVRIHNARAGPYA